VKEFFSALAETVARWARRLLCSVLADVLDWIAFRLLDAQESVGKAADAVRAKA
jgi:hypothetical protein